MFRALKYTFALLVFTSFFSCGQETEIHEWTFSEAGADEWHPAKVPGVVHLDLMANGLIPDPMVATNEDSVQWVETKDWEYKTTFLLSSKLLKKDHVEINFEGLDTYADVYLNDSLIITANNMHIPWSAEIKPFLKPDTNELRVLFHSAVRIGQQKLEELPYFIPASNENKPVGQQTSIFSRKAPYHYGWDWGPRLVSCGIWRDFSFSGWDDSKIKNVKIDVEKALGDTAICLVTIDAISPEGTETAAAIQFDGADVISKQISGTKNQLTYRVKIPNPKVWWPTGMGEQYLYDVNIDLLIDGKKRDKVSERIGLRTVELVREMDEDSLGKSFYLTINGHPTFMKGANYIPADFFNTRAANKYERVIQDALDANMNMLRIWGGAVYENDAFYDLCDEKGILIWQDFMFACAMVPTQDYHLKDIEIEAEAAVKRLHNHASIVLWCGNNENLSGWHGWNWQATYNLHDADSLAVWQTYDTLFNHILPVYVEEFGNGIYWPTSPSSDENELENKFSGDQHEWKVWFGQKPFSHFEENAGRFISEYGLQAFPDMSTIERFDPSVKEWELETGALNYRQRSKMPWIAEGFDGFDMMRYYVDLYYPAPDSLDEFVYLSQISQALSLEVATEAHRRNKPYTMGTLYWQLDDVWPTTSWATVDYFGTWKAGHYSVREANKPVIISANIEKDSVHFHIISDQLTPLKGNLNIQLKNMQGDTLKAWETAYNFDILENKIVLKSAIADLTDNQDQKEVFLDMTLTADENIIDKGILYFVTPKDLKLQDPEIEFSISGSEISLTAKSLAKNVQLRTKTMDGHFSDNYFDLIPGTVKKVTYSGTLTEASPLFIRSLFELMN